MATSHRALVGLGNPGGGYSQTRHNVGFMVLDRLRERWGWPPFRAKGKAELVSGRFDDFQVHLLKPMTYMNLSGQAVAALRRQTPLQPQDCMCIVDEFALPLGKLRLRASGSAGGHNGLKSLIADLGSQDFPRLRLGIGPVPEGWDPADFVLGRFASSEKETLETMLERSCDCVELWLRQGLPAAMNRYNG